MQIITISLCIVIVISMVIMAVLLYNFMQLLSTLNKRLVMIVGDILGNIDLSTPNINTLDTSSNNQINLEDILDEMIVMRKMDLIHTTLIHLQMKRVLINDSTK